MKMIYIRKCVSAGPFLSRSIAKNAASCEDSLKFCANVVRQHDYENFLATLLMTKAIRSPALVVRAFNVEVARIQDQTSDSQTAAFRLQFWHDALQNIYKKDQIIRNIPANPVAQELFKVCSCYNLPKRHLEKLITSRNDLLKTKYFKSLEEVEKYADDTVSSIFYLLLTIAGVTSVHADHAASHLGKAQGITNIIRSVHVAAHHKMVYLPMDILMRNKVSQEAVLRGIDSEDLRNVIFEMASRANSHLEKARKIDVPKISNQIFLPASSVEAFLKRLQKTNFDVFNRSLQLGSAKLPLNLYMKRIFNKY